MLSDLGGESFSTVSLKLDTEKLMATLLHASFKAIFIYTDTSSTAFDIFGFHVS